MTILAALTSSDWGGIHWRPGIGDPDFFGWFTVAAYVLAAFLCYKTWKAQARLSGPTKPRFWLFMVVAMVLLGINKQLDVQTLFTEVGRLIFEREGMMDQRRTYQAAFVAGVAATALLTILAMAWWLRGHLRRTLVVVIGLALVSAFVVIRAASFHHVDHFLGRQVWILKVNHILELGALAVVCLGALMGCDAFPPRARSGSGTVTQTGV